jgi:hypothetical protein
MSKAIQMTAGGQSFLVEADDSVAVAPRLQRRTLEGVAPGMQAVVDVDKVGRQFVEVQEVILACCNGLYEAIARLPRPEKVAVEFGIKLGGEAGVPMLTKASGEANFKISVEWKPPQTGG